MMQVRRGFSTFQVIARVDKHIKQYLYHTVPPRHFFRQRLGRLDHGLSTNGAVTDYPLVIGQKPKSRLSWP
jgi:hypothetical protein